MVQLKKFEYALDIRLYEIIVNFLRCDNVTEVIYVSLFMLNKGGMPVLLSNGFASPTPRVHVFFSLICEYI